MQKVRIELSDSGIRALLKSKEMSDHCAKIAHDTAQRAGDGYTTDTKQMSTRVIASVFTDTNEAYYDNLENNTLLKAIGGNK